MKKPSRLKHLVPVALALAVLAVIAARASGPLYVGGPGMAEGVPFVWAINPLTYWTDLGTLGSMDNTAANNLVADACKACPRLPSPSARPRS